MLDVAAYLARLGITHDGPPTLERLGALHAAHQDRVPYETIEIHLGRPTSIDPLASAQRIVEQRRGGYCFHLNGAFAELLAALGYDVVRHRGFVRSVDERVLPAGDPNHLALTVHGLPSADSPGGDWMVDVGLGEGFVDPLPLVPGRYERDGFGYAVERLDDDSGWVFVHDARGSFRVMMFGDSPAVTSDFAASHQALSMHEDSGFAKVVAVERRDRHALEQLHGCVLRRVTADDATDTRDIDSEAEWYAVLRDQFGLPLRDIDTKERAALWERVRAAHEAWVAAGRP
jgi:arylamine N-acetyltransferase